MTNEGKIRNLNNDDQTDPESRNMCKKCLRTLRMVNTTVSYGTTRSSNAQFAAVELVAATIPILGSLIYQLLNMQKIIDIIMKIRYIRKSNRMIYTKSTLVFLPDQKLEICNRQIGFLQ